MTLYLGETSLRNTLRKVKANVAEGSPIVADMYAKSFVSGEYARGMKATLPLLDITGEQLSFSIDMREDPQQALKTFLASEDLTVGEIYFTGHKTEKGAWMVVAEIKR